MKAPQMLQAGVTTAQASTAFPPQPLQFRPKLLIAGVRRKTSLAFQVEFYFCRHTPATLGVEFRMCISQLRLHIAKLRLCLRVAQQKLHRRRVPKA